MFIVIRRIVHCPSGIAHNAEKIYIIRYRSFGRFFILPTIYSIWTYNPAHMKSPIAFRCRFYLFSIDYYPFSIGRQVGTSIWCSVKCYFHSTHLKMILTNWSSIFYPIIIDTSLNIGACFNNKVPSFLSLKEKEAKVKYFFCSAFLDIKIILYLQKRSEFNWKI